MPVNTKAIKILLIEDDPIFANIFQNLFKAPDFVTIHSINGENCLDQIMSTGPDIIVLDLMLETHSGLDLLEQMRVIYTASVLPILVNTASDNADDISKAFELGANDYFVKPTPTNVMKARIKSLYLAKEYELLKQHKAEFELLKTHIGHYKNEISTPLSMAYYLVEKNIDSLKTEDKDKIKDSFDKMLKLVQRMDQLSNTSSSKTKAPTFVVT